MIGQWEDYTWAEGQWSCGSLITAYPQLVLGKRVVIAACDSGPLELSAAERARDPGVSEWLRMSFW